MKLKFHLSLRFAQEGEEATKSLRLPELPKEVKGEEATKSLRLFLDLFFYEILVNIARSSVAF